MYIIIHYNDMFTTELAVYNLGILSDSNKVCSHREEKKYEEVVMEECLLMYLHHE